MYLYYNIDSRYTLESPRQDGSSQVVLTSTLNLCFGSKIRKLNIKLSITPFYCIKKRISMISGVFISRTCFPDGIPFGYMQHSKPYLKERTLSVPAR